WRRRRGADHTDHRVRELEEPAVDRGGDPRPGLAGPGRKSMVRPALGGSCACAKMVEERVRVVRCGGSRLNFRRAVFSADSKYIFCVSGDFIKVYSSTTEECVHVLHGHKNLVSGILLNPNNHLQVPVWDGTC
ncbi:WD repeat-containing protein 75-like, partial [Alexandromys fortis]|uniref:WD repeat-containing protein 75-like n=1 Tax=Alexandromys fortis TaxID=100897 RepID=UPI0021529316